MIAFALTAFLVGPFEVKMVTANDIFWMKFDIKSAKYFVDSGRPYFRGADRSHASPLGRILRKQCSKALVFLPNVCILSKKPTC